MPRKPSLGPPIMRIEALSTGIDVLKVDDFNGEPLAQPNARPVSDPMIAHAARKRAQAAAGLNMLKAVGIVEDDRPKPLPGHQRIIAGMLWTFPKKPWRRV